MSFPIQLHNYFLHVVDRKTAALLFTASTDHRLARPAEAKRLIRALRQRIDDEEREAKK
jgi:hypothetical protein